MDNRVDLIANLPTFDGGEDVGKENPHAFIAKVRRTFLLLGLNDEQKIAVFELSLIEGGPAKEWFDGLTGDAKTTWNGLTEAFDTRWPARAVVAKTAAEKQDDLRQHTLAEKDLLQKKELTDGREAYSHVVWAEKALRLAKLIPDTNHLLVPQSKAQLPEALRDCLTDDCDTWESFTEAVKGVKLAKLRERIRKKEEDDKLRKKVESLENATRQPQTPSKLLANTLNRFRISAPIPQPNFNTARQPQRAPGTYRGGRSEQEKWEIISRLPDPPQDTPANRASHRDRVSQWHRENPTTNVTSEDRPYPCTPGTAQPGSGECLSCGKLGHMWATCTMETKLPEYEVRWRRKVNSIRRDANPQPAVGVNLVDDEDNNLCHPDPRPARAPYQRASSQRPRETGKRHGVVRLSVERTTLPANQDAEQGVPEGVRESLGDVVELTADCAPDEIDVLAGVVPTNYIIKGLA
ncbi:hypothetical protein H0H92_009517 [Tricholoma furcatifolium]|nr:hypothetical protein H0H92_009517 [Tricholoma furcatifolium]